MKIRVIIRYYIIGLVSSIIAINLLVLISCIISNDFSLYHNTIVVDLFILGFAFWLVSLMVDMGVMLISKKNSIIYKMIKELDQIDLEEKSNVR